MSSGETPARVVERAPAGGAPVSATPVQVSPPSGPDLATLVMVVLGVVVVAALYLGREVLIPITLAILLSFVLGPVVNLFRRLHLPRVLAVLLAVMLALCIIATVGSVIGFQIASLAPDLPRYASTIGQKINTVQSFAVGQLSEFAAKVGERVGGKREAQSPNTGPTARSAEPGQNPPIPVEVHQPNPGPLEIAQRVLAPVLNPLETTLIVLIVSIFILLQREDLRDRLIRLFGADDLHRTTTALDEAAHRLSRYFLSQLAINTAFGIVIGLGLFVIGVPSPVLWGILGGLLRFVPYIGSAIAAILPVALAAGVSPGWMMALETAALFVAIETLVGQFLEPLIYGHSTGLSPVSVVVAAVFWTWLWGPIGLILSTPLTLCLVILGRHVPRLEFLDVILGDRPALTPVENFYQRMLANDPDEALDQAELLLKERSLTAYYDEIALKGLRLAVNDAQRGVLTADQVDRVKNSIRSLVRDLADHDDRDPRPEEEGEAAETASQAERAIAKPSPPADAPEQLAPAWRTEAPVLCLAGRGTLDEAATAMLAQLLTKHNLGSRVAPHEAASREYIPALDVEGVAMVCISYLEISGSPAHLRYLVRRLRGRLPTGTPIVVGLWPAEDEVLHDHALQGLVGADHYTTSLGEAVEICVRLAHEQSAEAGSAVSDRMNSAKIVALTP
jgi:predicted PurR-regulated permease PerM